MDVEEDVHVDVTLIEMENVQGRTMFYDEYGVIRDVMQNHMTQVCVCSPIYLLVFPLFVHDVLWYVCVRPLYMRLWIILTYMRKIRKEIMINPRILLVLGFILLSMVDVC